MAKVFHILNGDALGDQFSCKIKGEQIIFREALVEGPVHGEGLESFFKLRAEFIGEFYADDQEEYFQKAANELRKVVDIPGDAEVNLWFEDDLFCQVNLWFCLHYLFVVPREGKVFLVRPAGAIQYGFANSDEEGLVKLLENKVELSTKEGLGRLWELYRNHDFPELIVLGDRLAKKFPFVQKAIQAHLARIPTRNSPGKPKESLKQIIEDLETDKFGPVFQEFCKRESIYGFGDLQVKRLFDEVLFEKS